MIISYHFFTWSKDSWTEIFNGSEQWVKEKETKAHVITAYAEYGRGKALAIGDVDVFSNDPNIGINCLDNRKFVKNLLNGD